jgi:hypothetical protein
MDKPGHALGVSACIMQHNHHLAVHDGCQHVRRLCHCVSTVVNLADTSAPHLEEDRACIYYSVLIPVGASKQVKPTMIAACSVMLWLLRWEPGCPLAMGATTCAEQAGWDSRIQEACVSNCVENFYHASKHTAYRKQGEIVQQTDL